MMINKSIASCKATTEIDESRTPSMRDLRAENIELKAKLDVANEALKWYADANNYKKSAKIPSKDKWPDGSIVYEKPVSKARIALAKINDREEPEPETYDRTGEGRSREGDTPENRAR